MESLFIELIRKKKNVWNIKSSYYKNRILRRVSFTEISTKLIAEYPQYASELDCEKLQKKFSNLKKVKTLTSGAGYEGACPWVHFNALKFLVDAENCEESFSNLEENDSLILSQNVEQSNDPLDSITFACSYSQDIVEDHPDYLEQEIMNGNEEQEMIEEG